jgi:3-oxo-5-alpha-steroid 4-dehydrogenase 1
MGFASYKIPCGGLFIYISGAHYLSKIIEWTGYAIASHSVPAYAFAVYTASNLIPRAVSHHRWYREHLKDYPVE